MTSFPVHDSQGCCNHRPFPVELRRMIQPAAQSATDEESAELALYERLCGTRNLDDLIPTLAKDSAAIGLIESAARRRATRHELILGDARRTAPLPDESVHLVLASSRIQRQGIAFPPI